MIVVDSSILISFLRAEEFAPALRLRHEIDANSVLVGDIVLLEVLRGARSDLHAQKLEATISKFEKASMLDTALARAAASHYRSLRARGFTVHKAADLIIGTFCIERGHALLHNDCDFDPMVEHLGLRLA